MPALFGLVVGLIIAVVYASTAKGAAQVTQQTTQQATQNADDNPLNSLYREIGTVRGVDPNLLKAIAMVESSENPEAVRWNPPYDVSVGLMQVLCVPPAGANPDDDFVPTNRFDVDGWPVSFQGLKDARTNLDIAAQIVRYNLSTFGMPRGIAVYNDWSMRMAGVNGPFENQKYVDKVLANLAAIKGA